MNAFFALVRKDLVLYFSSRRSVVMSIVAPILIAAFFGSLFGGGTKPSNIPIAVADLDHSELSAGIVAALQREPALKVAVTDEADALAQVEAGRVRAAVTLPAGFGAGAPRAMFGAGAKPEVVIVHDPSQTMVLPLVNGLLAQHAMERVSQSAFGGSSATLNDLRDGIIGNTRLAADRRAELAAMFDDIARVQSHAAATPASAASAGAGSFSVPYTTRVVEAGSRPDAQYNGYSHSFAGMGVQFILLMGVDMAIGLLTMRRLGLWMRLRAAPLSRAKLLGSRIASTALIAIIVFAVIYAVAIAVFGVRVTAARPDSSPCWSRSRC